jgi:ABC-2 type transport system permease protein
MITTLIIFFLSPLLFSAILPSSIPIFFLTIVLLLLTSCLLGILIALFSKSSGRLALYAQIVFLPTVMLSGIMFSVDLLPDPLAFLSNIIPGKHAMDLLTNSSSAFHPYLYFLITITIISTLIFLRLRRLRYENN